MRFLVRLDAPTRLPELVDTLTRAECLVRAAGVGAIEVEVPRAPSADQAKREIQIYLALWHAQNPDARATLALA